MRELEQRGIDCRPTMPQFLDGLETLAEDFAVAELRQLATAIRRREVLPAG